MFSNLLLGTLQRFQKEEKKISSTEKVQVWRLVQKFGVLVNTEKAFKAEKQEEVERRLRETEMEEKERIAKERMELLEKRREKERQRYALQRKKAIIQYVGVLCYAFQSVKTIFLIGKVTFWDFGVSGRAKVGASSQIKEFYPNPSQAFYLLYAVETHIKNAGVVEEY